MSAALLLLAIAAPPSVPVAGRPADFSGAVGGPFKLKLLRSGATIPADGEATFWLRISGPGELGGVKWPTLSLPAGIMVEPQKVSKIAKPPGIEFEWKLRGRDVGKYTIPRFKFVYYDPAVRAWQTTYSDPWEFPVERQTPSLPEMEPSEELRQWVEMNRDSHDKFSMIVNEILKKLGLPQLQHVSARWHGLLWLLWLLPAIAAAGWIIWTKPASPKARTLATLKLATVAPAQQVRRALLNYLYQTDRLATPSATAHEINAIDPAMADLIEQCEEAIFGRPRNEVSADFASKAAKVIIGGRAAQ